MKRALSTAPFACAAIAACSTTLTPSAPAPIDPASLMTTLGDLAAFGEKRVGTAGGAKAGDYVLARMRTAKLYDVHEESFGFPRYDLASASLAMTVDGAASSPGFDVFEASGAGHVDADLVFVGSARPDELTGKDLHRKIALVERNVLYHRSAQLDNVAKAGAAAMLYLSVAPDNLRQIGSVRHGWEALVAIPAITIGAVDGAAIKSAAMAGKKVHATLDIKATTTPAVGRNIVGRIEGSDPNAGEIVIGAHYDTWFTGSSDNGGGVAALLALASRRLRHERPLPTMIFVAYDGEEVALFGGYDFLRRHKIVGKEPITFVINFEIPSSTEPTLVALAHSNIANLDDGLREATLQELYPSFGNMGIVPSLFGGIIPTDIQGIYRNGVPTVTTAVQGPYYHTTADTPDKVDLPFLADAVDRFDRALDKLVAEGPACCSEVDPEVWKATVALRPRAGQGSLLVDATVTDSTGAPQVNASADATLLYDDFFQAATVHGTTDAAGKVTFEIPGDKAALGSGKRYVHVTAGQTYPLVEQIVVAP